MANQVIALFVVLLISLVHNAEINMAEHGKDDVLFEDYGVISTHYITPTHFEYDFRNQLPHIRDFRNKLPWQRPKSSFTQVKVGLNLTDPKDILFS